MILERSIAVIEALTSGNASSLRDPVFRHVLSLFGDGPVNICQVGAIETFEQAFLFGSGWADRVFGAHVRKHGGRYQIIDVDLDHLANSLLVADLLGHKVEIRLDRGESAVAPGFDLYYLDGSNDPSEMLAEVNNIRHHPCVILCDDWSVKGGAVRSLFDWTVLGVANGMAFVDLRRTCAPSV